MLLDLVSPWVAAVEAESAAQFRARHAVLLEALRRHRTPHVATFALPPHDASLRVLARHWSDPDVQARWRQRIEDAQGLGANGPFHVAALPGAGPGDPVEVVPDHVVLLIDGDRDEHTLTCALARGMAAATRWTSPDSLSMVRLDAPEWNRWRAAADVPLREWIYAEGVGIHLAAAILPDVEPAALLELTPGAFRRMREREHLYQELLDNDLDRRGVGLVVRWLASNAPATARTVDGATIPLGAGRYLAWRMTAERVERAGISSALRAVA